MTQLDPTTLVIAELGARIRQLEALEVPIIGGGGGGAPDDATYLVLGPHVGLTAERQFVDGMDLTGVDLGANSTYTLNHDNTAVTPGGYGSATQVATFTVNQRGHLTAAANVAISGVPPSAHNLLSAYHGDTAVGAAADGDTIIGNVSPAWSRLAISIPAANVLNVLGVANGELRPSWKSIFDATNPTTIAIGAAASPGTSLLASHRDHTHGAPATWTATAHNLLSAIHGDTAAAAAADGDIIIGNVTPAWSRLAVSIPAANVRNVLGVDNGELRPSWKTALDATAPTTIAPGAAAAAGTSLVFSHRDHTHGAPATWPSSDAWALLGNTGTTAFTNFVGTTDHIALVFKTRGVVHGVLGSTSAAGIVDGNTRGLYAVDWQAARSGVTFVASGNWSSILGGSDNIASGNYSSVCGGWLCTASGESAIALGGVGNVAAGDYSVACGRLALVAAAHDGTFLFADQTFANFNSAAANEAAFRARGGFRHVYDDANYWKASISAAGVCTFSTLPVGAGFVFTPAVTFTAAPLFSTMTNTWMLYAGASGVLSGSANATLDASGNAYFAGNVYINPSSTNVNYNALYVNYGMNATVNGTYYDVASRVGMSCAIAAGVTSLGYAVGNYTAGLRYAAADAGTLENNFGHVIQLGHYDSGVGFSGTTATTTGIDIALYAQVGTLTNQFGLRINYAPGGTVTNPPWGVYVAHASLQNYFAGNVGIGITPTSKLHVWGATQDAIQTIANIGATNSSANSKSFLIRVRADDTSELVLFRTDSSAGGDPSLGFSVGTDTPALLIDPSGYVTTASRFGCNGVATIGGAIVTTAQLTVDQSNAAGTIAVCDIDQADDSEEFINFISSVGNGMPVDTVTNVGLQYARLRIAINGTFKYLQVYDA